MTATREGISSFYDARVSRQRMAAFNERHLFLADLLVALGLRDGSRVLELGCGIGVVTSLIAERNSSGRIVAIDLSPASIEAARASLAWAPNVELSVDDVVAYRSAFGGSFDFVTLFDVLEHIPVEQHAALFGNLATQMPPGALLVINIPSPAYLEYLGHNEPEKLQIVDQPLLADRLVQEAYASGLELSFFVTYGLWLKDDYQVMAFRRRVPFRCEPVAPQARWVRWLNGLLQGLARRGGHPLLWWLGAR